MITTYTIEQVGKIMTCLEGKIRVQKYDNKTFAIKFITDENLLNHIYVGLLNPQTKKYMLLPLDTNNTVVLGTSVSKYAGVWDMLLLSTDEELDEDDIDQSKFVYVTNTIKCLLVVDNFLKDNSDETQIEPSIQVLYDEIVNARDDLIRLQEIVDEQAELTADNTHNVEVSKVNIEAMKLSVETHLNNIIQMYNEIQDNLADSTNLHQNVQTLKVAIDSIYQNIKDLKGEVDTSTQTIINLKKNIETTKSNIDDIKTLLLEKLDISTANANAAISKANEANASAIKANQSAISAKNSSDTALSYKNETQQIYSDISEIKTNINQTSNNINTMKNEIKDIETTVKNQADYVSDLAEQIESIIPTLQDGKSLEYLWDETALGVKLEGEDDFSFVELKGDPFTYEDFTDEQLNALKGEGTEITISDDGYWCIDGVATTLKATVDLTEIETKIDDLDKNAIRAERTKNQSVEINTDLQDRIQLLSTTISSFDDKKADKSTVSTLNNTVTGLSNTINELDQQKADKSTVETLKQTDTTITTKVNELENKTIQVERDEDANVDVNTELQDEIDSLKETLAEQGATLETLKTDKATKEEVNTLRQDLTTIIKGVTQQLYNYENEKSYLKSYFNTTISSESDNFATIFIKCDKNTTYTISRKSGTYTRFGAGCTTELPKTGIPITTITQTIVIKNGRGYMTVTTTEDAEYLCIYYYNASSDTDTTELELRKDIMIYEGQEFLPYESYNTISIQDTALSLKMQQLPQKVKELNETIAAIKQAIIDLGGTI